MQSPPYELTIFEIMPVHNINIAVINNAQHMIGMKIDKIKLNGEKRENNRLLKIERESSFQIDFQYTNSIPF